MCHDFNIRPTNTRHEIHLYLDGSFSAPYLGELASNTLTTFIQSEGKEQGQKAPVEGRYLLDSLESSLQTGDDAILSTDFHTMKSQACTFLFLHTKLCNACGKLVPDLKKASATLISDVRRVESAGKIEPPAFYAVDLDSNSRQDTSHTKLRSLFADTWRRKPLPLVQSEKPYGRISYTGVITRDHFSMDLDVIPDDEPSLFFFHKGTLVYRFDGAASAETVLKWLQALTPDEVADYFWKGTVADWPQWHEESWVASDGTAPLQQFKPSDLSVSAEEKAEPMKAASKPLLMLFHTVFCETCGSLRDRVEEVSASLLEDKGDAVTVATMDCSGADASTLCLRLGATSTPTIMWFPRGIKVCAASTHYCDGIEYKNAATTRALLQFVGEQSLDATFNSERAAAVSSFKESDRVKRQEQHKEVAAKKLQNAQKKSRGKKGARITEVDRCRSNDDESQRDDADEEEIPKEEDTAAGKENGKITIEQGETIYIDRSGFTLTRDDSDELIAADDTGAAGAEPIAASAKPHNVVQTSTSKTTKELIQAESEALREMQARHDRHDSELKSGTKVADPSGMSNALEAQGSVDILKEDSQIWPIVVQKPFAFLLFYAPWCQNCKALSAPWMEAAETMSQDKNVIFAAVDCGEDGEPTPLCVQAEIKQIPSVLFYKYGKLLADATKVQTAEQYAQLLASPADYIAVELPRLSPVQTTECQLLAGNCSIVAKIAELKRDRARLEEARGNLRKAQSELESRAAAAEADRARLLKTEAMLEAQLSSTLEPSSELTELLDKAKRVVKDSPVEAIHLLQDTATRFANAYGHEHVETKATQKTVDELIKLTKLYQASLAEAGLSEQVATDQEEPCEDKMPHQTMILMEGAPASCTKLQPHCTHPESGGYVRKACPQTCGVCAASVASGGGGGGGGGDAAAEHAASTAAAEAAAALPSEAQRAAREVALLTETKPSSAAGSTHTAGVWRSVGRKTAWGGSVLSAPEPTVHIRSGPSSAAESASAAAEGLDVAAAAAAMAANNADTVKPHPAGMSSVPSVVVPVGGSKGGEGVRKARGRLLQPPPRII